MAREALVEEMSERPVVANRYPLLHKYGLMAFYPKLVSDTTLHLPPLVFKGFGADVDGDTMQWHILVRDKSIQDAQKMLPSHNLWGAAALTKPMYAPGMEYLQGLHAASTAKENRRPLVFKDRRSALDAYQRGELGLGQSVDVLD
jgi:DNA-directed RNA polymerase subunit beta'